VIVTPNHIATIVRRAREYGAKRLILFGSALETPNDANDIDLAADISGLEVFSFADDLERDFQCPVDILPLNSDTDGHPFVQYVLGKGKDLLANTTETALFSEEYHNLILPKRQMDNRDLREQLTVELASLDIVAATFTTIPHAGTDNSLSYIESAAIFSLCIQLYGGFENILKRVCKFYHVPLPIGEDSHQQLMSRFMATEAEREYPALPILIPTSLTSPLTTLRRFRHAAVHGYSHQFDNERLLLALQQAPDLYAAFKGEVEGFLATLPNESE
jgi:predicted nucleotidyltransferase